MMKNAEKHIAVIILIIAMLHKHATILKTIKLKIITTLAAIHPPFIFELSES
jgi:hypothetical protein